MGTFIANTGSVPGIQSEVVSDENILCEHHLQWQSTPVRPLDPYLEVMGENWATRFAF